MKRFLFLLAAVVLLVIAAGCGGSSGPKSVPTSDVALVGDQEIAKAQLNTLLADVKAAYDAKHTKLPAKTSPQYKQLQDQLVQFLVQNTEFEQKAKALGITVTDKDVQQKLTQLKQQAPFLGNEQRFQQALKQEGLTERIFIETRIRPGLLTDKLSAKVTSSVSVPDSAVKAYFDAHPEFERRSVRHILVNSKTLADQLYTRLKAGASFAALAKKYSKDVGTAAHGGKLDIARGQTVPEFDKTAFALKPNELSKPVHTQYGWHIIQALGPVHRTLFAQVKEPIRQQLVQQKKSEAVRTFLDDVQKDYCHGKIVYQVGYAPTTDPCAASTTSISVATATSTTS